MSNQLRTKRPGTRLFVCTHFEHSNLSFGEEAVFASGHIFLGQNGKIDPIQTNNLVSQFFENTTYHSVLTGMDLNPHLLHAVFFYKFKGIGFDGKIFQFNAFENFVEIIF